MPYRRIPFVVHEIYHVFNRSIAREPIFINKRDYERVLHVIEFYSYNKPGLRFSFFNRLPQEQRSHYLNNLKAKHRKSIGIMSYCLMPSHVHFVLEEIEEGGIARFMSNIQNSYAKYFNTKNKRSGSLFQSMFKAVRIETDEQLLHVVRYIHLNPLTSYVVKERGDLEKYPWSSYQEYLGQARISNPHSVLRFYQSLEEFIIFTLDQTDYQRELDKVKHLILDKP